MIIISAVFLLALAAVEPLSAATTIGPGGQNEEAVEVCCDTKTVGDHSYTKVSTGAVPTNCLNNCIYTRDGMPNSRYCFATGVQKVQCLGGMPGNCVNADAFFDEVITRVDKFLADPANGFNPKSLPSLSKNFSISGQDIDVSGEGNVTGLQTILRTGPAVLCVGKRIDLSASIGVKFLKAIYDLTITGKLFGIDIDLHPGLTAINDQLNISFTASLGPGIPGPGGLIINKFEITNLDDTKFTVTGYGPDPNKILEDILDSLIKDFGGILENIISNDLKKELQTIINGELHTGANLIL